MLIECMILLYFVQEINIFLIFDVYEGFMILMHMIILQVTQAIPLRLHLNSLCSAQSIKTILEQLGVGIVKLILHQIQILDGQRQQIAFILTSDRKLPLERLSPLEPIIDIETILIVETSNYVRYPKVFRFEQLNIHQILVSRQNESAQAFLEEVNVVDGVIVLENKLFRGLDQWLQQWADPSSE